MWKRPVVIVGSVAMVVNYPPPPPDKHFSGGIGGGFRRAMVRYGDRSEGEDDIVCAPNSLRMP